MRGSLTGSGDLCAANQLEGREVAVSMEEALIREEAAHVYTQVAASMPPAARRRPPARHPRQLSPHAHLSADQHACAQEHLEDG